MKSSRVSIRYAKSLLQLAIEKDFVEASFSDMFLISNVLSENKELKLLLKSPIINTDQKIKILDEIFSKKITQTTMMFINIITNKKRESLLGEITNSFITLYKAYKKIETAEIITAKPIDERMRQEVINFIKKNSGKNVELTEKTDESILGGIVINMGDKQLDASVLSSLKTLKQEFNKNLYLQDY